ncbi:hypothetical protein IWW37_001111 [Coemansia sp. RSA 2050]|nr:hypothetical protein IWW37_001111 [Coemansia sp. RSA 2050]
MTQLGQARNTGWVAEPAAMTLVAAEAGVVAAAAAVDAAEALYAEVVAVEDEEAAAVAAAVAAPVLGVEAVPGVEKAGVAEEEEAAYSTSSAGWGDLGGLYGGTQKSAKVPVT